MDGDVAVFDDVYNPTRRTFSRNSQIHSIGLLICSRALSDPAVQSYELRIQQSGYSQILIGNESVPKTRYELVQPLSPCNQRSATQK